MNILLIEDEPRLAAFVKKGLTEEGHVVDVAGDGVTGLSLAHVGTYDVIIVDVMLPGKNGFQVTAELRSAGDHVPILMLTARDTQKDLVHGLDVGADDYLTKPFDFEELLARLRALGRRSHPIQAQTLRFGDLEVDRLQRIVRRGATRVDLTPTEFRLLEALLRVPGQIVRRTELLDRVWGMGFDPGTGLIDVHMSNLRRKLESGGGSRIVQAIKGVGFQLVGPEES